jgi:hypothetical protein
MMIRYQQENVRQKNCLSLLMPQRHVGGGRGRAPLILNLGTGWKFNSTKKRREMDDDDDDDDGEDDKISTGKCTAESVYLSLLMPQRHVRGVEVELR